MISEKRINEYDWEQFDSPVYREANPTSSKLSLASLVAYYSYVSLKVTYVASVKM